MMTKLLPKIKEYSKTILKSRIFLKNFFILLGIMSVFYLCFAIYTYRNSREIIESEFISSNQYSAEVMASSVENYIMEVRYIAATLDTNDLVRTYFASRDPEAMFTGIYSRIQEQLKAFVSTFAPIDSIYLYSEASDTILTAYEKTSTGYFTDMNWIDHFNENPEVYTIFPRVKNGSYPYLLTLMKQLSFGEYDAAIVVNINLAYLPNLIEVQENPYQEAYLILNDDTILFRNQQRTLKEPIADLPILSEYDTSRSTQSLLVKKYDNPYTFIQIPSASYPWSYVLITNLAEYTYRLTDSRAVVTTLIFILFLFGFIMALFFSMHSFKPIHELKELLEQPEGMMTFPHKSDKEIAFIANRIINYIQSNQQLSKELTERLHLLNETKILALQSQINPHFLFNTLNMIHILEIDALGYDHPVPKLTLTVSKLLRYAIDSTDLVRLETELDYTKLYLGILNERYGNKLNVTFDVDSSILTAKVPKLIIQPLIENAVFHGLSQSIDEHSAISISCSRVNEKCHVTVHDNGIGMNEETLHMLQDIIKEPSNPQGSIGLKNIVMRMTLLYGDSFQMFIDSKEQAGSTFRLEFPII